MKKTISIILIAVFAAVLSASTYFIVRHNKEADKQARISQPCLRGGGRSADGR